MPIVDSQTGEVRVNYSVEELEAKAQEMRAWSMISITAAGSGHTGGCMSIMDITAGWFRAYRWLYVNYGYNRRAIP